MVSRSFLDRSQTTEAHLARDGGAEPQEADDSPLDEQDAVALSGREDVRNVVEDEGPVEGSVLVSSRSGSEADVKGTRQVSTTCAFARLEMLTSISIRKTEAGS